MTVQVSALRKLLRPHAISTFSGRGYWFFLDIRLGNVSPPNEIHQPRSAIGAKPTIPVLPFNVLSDDLQINFLAEGVTALLARVPGFLLISRAPSFVFRGQSPDFDKVD